MDINLAFTRRLLAMAHENIRKAFPDVKVNSNDVIGVSGPSFRQYYVEIRVEGFPPFDNWYSADNRYEAKYKAWMRFFDRYAPDQIKREVLGERAVNEAILEVTK